MRGDNAWWAGGKVRGDYANFQARGYFARFAELTMQDGARRAVVLMGPRRVGKTVMLHHLIRDCLGNSAFSARNIAYLSLDQPLYSQIAIEQLAIEAWKASRAGSGPKLLILDEIQYLVDWEQHLKAFVDAHPDTVCVASGSAAAALRLKSMESGAGRFTDFLLPPLTFYEYLHLRGHGDLVQIRDAGNFGVQDIHALNREFVDYCNFGGYPEAALSETVRKNPQRYIRADIVDKVLLRDLPSLYGIHNVQELNALFCTLAYNTAGEVSLEGLSQNSGVSKTTIQRYLEYLQAAFLVRIVHRVDRNAKRFMRATRFKVYLTTPALRSVLFDSVHPDDDAMGAVAETAAFAQWFHSNVNLHYASWRQSRRQHEVDMVRLDARQEPAWCVEIKWSDRIAERMDRLQSLVAFSQQHPEMDLLATTRTQFRKVPVRSIRKTLHLLPTSLYCFGVGYRAIHDPAAGSAWMAAS